MAGPAAPIVAAAVGGGMSIGSTLIAGRQSKKNQDRTIAANKAESELAYQRDIEMWNRQNEYNSPAAQMERLKAAGLNPNLAYGNGTVGNNSSSPPSYNTPTQEYNQKPAVGLDGIPLALEMYQNFSLRQAQIDNVRAQTDNIAMRTVSEDFRQNLMRIQGRKTEQDADIVQSLWPYNAQIKQSEAERSTVSLDQAIQGLKNMKEDERIKILQQDTMRTGMDESRIRQEKMQAEKLFQNYKNDWIKMGVTTADNALLRIFVRMLNESGVKDFDDLQGVLKNLLPSMLGY